ncbi:glycosyltransferase, partial [Paraglaciecola sp.]|uniref:glycosyltransferase n=1 Tax=Paraglaciecola sp. TaxID=1920173 RepID=UPI0027400963
MRVRHICFFLNSVNFGGSEQYLYSLSENFIKDGVKVTFISSGGKMERKLIESGAEILNIPIVGIFKDKIAELPFKHRLVLNNWWFFGPLYGFFLNKKLKNVDTIICQHGFPSILASDFSRKNNCKLVNIVHHLLPNEYTDIYNQLNVKPDVFVAISQEIKDFLTNQKFVKNNLIISNP